MNKKLIQTLALSSLFSFLLVLIRVQWSGNLLFAFLLWNLFLAWIPFLLSEWILSSGRSRTGIFFGPVFLAWLLFFPNAPYLLTDLFHLHPRPEIPFWYDLLLIFSFSWNGILLGFISLLNVQNWLQAVFPAIVVRLFSMILLALCSFGIYLGRYPRFNSWDVLTDPGSLFSQVITMIVHPFHYTRMVGVTFFFSLFLMIAYRTFLVLIQHSSFHEKESSLPDERPHS